MQLGLSSEDEVRTAFERILERVATHSKSTGNAGVLVQPMCSGVELLIGVTRDPELGPLLAFGLGGTDVDDLRV